jgi:hypothetical protein
MESLAGGGGRMHFIKRMRTISCSVATLLCVIAAPAAFAEDGSRDKFTGSQRMTCTEALSEIDAPVAARRFSTKNSNRFSDLHKYMLLSGFELRNTDHREHVRAYVYVFYSGFKRPCFFRRLLMIDGTLVIVEVANNGRVLSID